MEAQNAYSPPQGDLTNQQAVAFNEPKFLSLSGRIGRLRYLAYGSGLMLIFYAALAALLGVFGVSMLAGGGSGGVIAIVIMVLLYIPLIVFSWGYMVRRLNDLDKSGWLSLLMLVPLVNIGMALYLLFGRGTEGNNNYGAPPPPNTTGVIVLSCVLPAIAIIGMLAAIALPAYQSYVMRSQAAQFEQSNDYAEPATDEAAPADEATDEAATDEAAGAAESADESGAAETEENYSDEPADEGNDEAPVEEPAAEASET